MIQGDEKKMILQNHTKLAQRAHDGTSFSPEKRGDYYIKIYSEELQQDIAEFIEAGIAPETVQDYRERYERFFVSYLHAKSRCISPMITGPANFPVRRAQKANRSEQKHYEVFREWRDRAKRSIYRKAAPEKTYTTELDRYKMELAQRESHQVLMKTANAIIRKAKGADCTKDLIAAGLSEQLAAAALNPVFTKKLGFLSFEFSNNLANINRIKDRITVLSQKAELAASVGEKVYPFDGGNVVVNYEANRVQIKHDSKPLPEVIQKLKKNGFRWSPTNAAWQRQITLDAIYKTNQLTNAGAVYR